MRVTKFDLTPFGKLKSGEVGNDEWSFEASITSRSQVGSGG